VACVDQILFVFIAEKVGARTRRTRLGETRSAERVRNENGTSNCAGIVWLTENFILRSRKRRNSGGSEGTAQGLPLGYGFHAPQPIDSPFLIFNHSQDHEGQWNENRNGGQNSGKHADGYVSFAPGQNVTETLM
jgi:hypothetical protein